jgi:hypothetical protein
MLELTQEEQKEIAFFDGHQRPVLPHRTTAIFREADFAVGADGMSGLSERYPVALAPRDLPPAPDTVNRIDFTPNAMRSICTFVLTHGEKP